jgi:outer membrane protein TolC
MIAGCSPTWYRREADKAATTIIDDTRQDALGQDGEFTIERPVDTLRRRLLLDQQLPQTGPESLGADQLEPIDHWPEDDYPYADDDAPPNPLGLPVNPGEDPDPLVLTLLNALEIAAANSRDYQTRKEDVFQAALDLDLESDAFRNTFTGVIDSLHTQNPDQAAPVRGVVRSAEFDWSKRFETGAELTAGLALDLARLISSGGAASFGILADASISIPLMRGAGRHIVTEPMTQAQRNVIYSLYTLERFKRTLAVQVASEYLSVLQQLDRIQNELNNYKRLLNGSRRAQRLSEAGRLPEFEVDQARQDALTARNRWIAARQTYDRQLDQFKLTLGLPTDAVVALDPAELGRLAELAAERLPPPEAANTDDDQTGDADEPIVVVLPSQQGGPLEMPSETAIGVGLTRRLDLLTLVGRVFDAQRQVVVLANALEMGLALTGTASAGERRGLGTAGAADAEIRPQYGTYTFGFELDLPMERTAEQNAYRESYISLERSVRNVQRLEDQIKLEIRNALRTLLEARESYRIQAEAVYLAERRVESTALLLRAGRANVRDVLEAQESLLQAQNALTAALVNYRVAELDLQRDMGVLQVSDNGMWHEFDPTTIDPS